MLCFGLVTAEPIQARRTVSTTIIYHDHSDIDLAKAALCTFGIALLAYGVYSLYNYLHVPNQKLIEDTQILLNRAKSYHDLAQILLSQQLTADSFIPEQTLFEIANKIGTSISISSYINELSRLEYEIDTRIRKINKRSIKLKRKLNSSNGICSNKIEDQCLLTAMLNLESAARPVLRNLNLLFSCLDRHAGYIELAQSYTIFNRKYYLELTAINTGNINNLKQLARAAVASEYVLYPLLQYSRMLKNDTSALSKNLCHIRFDYPILVNQAQTLQDQMGHIYRLIVSDSDYVMEQNARREAEQREERLRIERERLELQHAIFLAELSNRRAKSTVIMHNH